MDEDGNGSLSTSELDDAMTALGVSYTREDLADLMHEFDTNGRCLVVKAITVYSYSFLFNYTMVAQASDSITTLT